MTIDELAREAGTTTRNIRALQTSSLLVKPEIVGRTARYAEEHLARLVTVLRLQGDGFSIASIRALFEAMSAGRSLAEVLGVSAPSSSSGSSSEGPGMQEWEPGPSPDPHGHLYFGASMEDEEEHIGTHGTWRHMRLLSDIPTTILDAAI
jgi:DNA-binding transcriptional MerR regulator